MRLLFLSFFVFFSIQSYGNMSGSGCRDGNYIYVGYLGVSEWYGTTYKVYDANGSRYEIYYNTDPANNYDCHKVNSNGAYNQVRNDTYSTPNNSSQGTCWIDNTAGNVNTSQGRYSTYVYYTVDCPANATATPPANLPLDDYIPIFICAIGALGFFILKKQQVWTPLV